VRALYNAGNNAAAEGKLQAALGFYRQALLRDPAYDRARYNYEFLKRKLQERQQQRTDEQRAPEPSDYARRLKRQAETMVQRRQYEAAHTLMQEGLQQDSTVAAYRGFMQRIGEVSRINRGGSSP
jgi:tetratricopeptide (TPR) repeat protein